MNKKDDESETGRLLARAAEGEQRAWEVLLDRHRDRLRRMVALRLDRRLQGRVDASDVVQEASLEAVRRLPEYLKNPKMPFYLWLRFLTGQRLTEQHRIHLGAKARDAGREVALYQGALPASTSAALAAQLLGRSHHSQRSRRTGGAADPDAGRPEFDGPDRPGGPGPAALRAALELRGRHDCSAWTGRHRASGTCGRLCG